MEAENGHMGTEEERKGLILDQRRQEHNQGEESAPHADRDLGLTC